MKVNIYDLLTKPSKRFLARFCTECTITLSTGKEVTFYKIFDEKNSHYEVTLSNVEKKEYVIVMMLIGFAK